MTQWDAIVIGSGLGGLAAGAAFARAGKKVLVLERQANFGGCATVYRHASLTMEASLHEIDGLELTSEHGVLRQLGLADRVTPVATDVFYEARSPLFPHPVRAPHGITACEADMRDAFPHAAGELGAYFALMRRLADTLETLEDIGARGPGAIAQVVFSGRLFEFLGETGKTVGQELQRLLGSHEDAKLALAPHMLYFDDDPQKLSFLVFALITSRYLEGGSYYLKGGSRTLTDGLLHAIREAGGDAQRKRTVVAILTDSHGAVVGVRHVGPDGAVEEAHAPTIFGNAAPSLLAEMLPTDQRAAFLHPYGAFEPSISLFTVQLGLSRPAAEFGVAAYSTFVYPDWMQRLDQMPISADVFGGEPGAALPVYALCDYSRLDAGLRTDGDPYLASLTGVDRLWAWQGFDEATDKARRERWMDALIADLDRRYPGMAGAVVHREMSTARTIRNRLGTPTGEVYGFRPTPARLFSRPPTPRTAVEGLWLASAYTVSGGFSGALHGGLLAGHAALGAVRRQERRAHRGHVLYG
jgi:phytoene dehydrogenase-like protein